MWAAAPPRLLRQFRAGSCAQTRTNLPRSLSQTPLARACRPRGCSSQARPSAEENGGETLLYRHDRPLFYSVVSVAATAHTGFWVWAIWMRDKIEAAGNTIDLSATFDYLGCAGSFVILAASSVYAAKNVAEIRMLDALRVRITTYRPFGFKASRVVATKDLMLHPQGTSKYFCFKEQGQMMYTLVSKDGMFADKERLLNVLQGRPGAAPLGQQHDAPLIRNLRRGPQGRRAAARDKEGAQ
mmetsp:Transcript_13867/g.44417  ORF Transcript_13867/g.44417 Transcript_13867/m.44417 type:complete len:241 (-) Transcript_13867:1166-1888(-)